MIQTVYIYVFAVIGMKYFAKYDNFETRGNFNNLLFAASAVFQTICLEKWSEVTKLPNIFLTNFNRFFINIYKLKMQLLSIFILFL